MKTIIALGIAVLMLAACNDDNSGGERKTRIICQEQSKTILDDYAENGVVMESGAVAYESQTTRSRMRATGQCVSYAAAKPDGWKAVIPGQ